MNVKYSLVLILVALAVTVVSFSGFFTQRGEHKGEKYTRYENRLLLITLYSSVFLVIGLSNVLCKQFGMSENIRNSWIMVWLCIPSAVATATFIPWILEYLCSINTVLSGKVVPKLVTTNFEGDSSLNLGVTSLGKTLVYLAWVIPAVAFWAFPRLASVFIEYWEYGIESQINLLVNGAAWKKFLLAITVILIFVVIWSGYNYFNNIYQNVKEWIKDRQKYKKNPLPYPVKETERKFLISIIVLKVYNYWYLYGFNKVAMRNLLFWVIVIALVGLFTFANFVFKHWKSSSNDSGSESDDGSTDSGGGLL